MQSLQIADYSDYKNYISKPETDDCQRCGTTLEVEFMEQGMCEVCASDVLEI